MEASACKHCSKTRDLIKCEMCPTSYCIPCDNTQNKLKWVEITEERDMYLCPKCSKRVLEPH